MCFTMNPHLQPFCTSAFEYHMFATVIHGVQCALHQWTHTLLLFYPISIFII